VFAIFISFFLYEFYNRAKPFIDKQTATVSRVGQVTVLVSFFFALMIRGNLVSDKAFIAAGLIMANILIFFLTLYYGKLQILQNIHILCFI
jgi:hypothetical protein